MTGALRWVYIAMGQSHTTLSFWGKDRHTHVRWDGQRESQYLDRPVGDLLYGMMFSQGEVNDSCSLTQGKKFGN